MLAKHPAINGAKGGKAARWSLLLTLTLAAACAHAPTRAPDSESLVFSIQGLACVDCAKELEATAARQPGVRGAKFDDKRVELAVDVARGTAPGPIARALEAEEIDGVHVVVVLGAGQGRFAPFKPLDPAWDAKTLSGAGEDVADFNASPGKATVVDFYADWCGPCHELDDAMHRLLADDPKLAYRRLNVVDWDSPLAKHYLGNAKELPYVVVLDVRGHEVATLSGLKLDALKAAIVTGERP